MAYGRVDPASLEGDALTRWYRRTPQEIEMERRQAATDAYNRFFYPTHPDQTLAPNDAASDDQNSPSDGGKAPTVENSGQADPGTGYGAAPWVAPDVNRLSPPTPGLVTRSLGLLSIVPAITGLFSGRIRHDTPMHMMYDMIGYPAPDDYDRMVDPRCRAMGVNNPGERCT
jgi:hypothetical protein